MGVVGTGNSRNIGAVVCINCVVGCSPESNSGN